MGARSRGLGIVVWLPPGGLKSRKVVPKKKKANQACGTFTNQRDDICKRTDEMVSFGEEKRWSKQWVQEIECSDL